MKASRPLEPEDTISGVVEAVSFDNTLGEIERAIKAWGHDSLDDRKNPHTCTIDRQFWPSVNTGCTITNINGREK